MYTKYNFLISLLYDRGLIKFMLYVKLCTVYTKIVS